MLSFRKSTEADIERIANLEESIFSDPWSCESIYDTFSQKQAFITVATMGETIVGYCIIYFVLDEGEIARIAVEESVRRQGVARSLLAYTCQCCKEKQIFRLLLDVRESNEGARIFYDTQGFCEDGIRKNFYQTPVENAILMSKELG